MKTLKYLTILALLLTRTPAFAQETTPESSQTLEQELITLNQNIDLYFDQMLSLKSTLAINDLKVTSPKSRMGPEITKALETLEDNKLVLIDSIKDYREQILEASKNLPLESVDKIKFLYDVVLVKAFLPRYDVAQVSIFTRVFSSYQPQYVEELITRSETLNLFFSEFETNESTKDALSASYRVSELTKLHNSITSKINHLRDSNLFQTYPKNVKLQDGLHEAQLYQSMIRGEEFTDYKPVESSVLVVNKVAEDHFTIAVTCAGLFSL